ncbi:transposase [Streptomyces sp. NBC_00233]|uniref:transposase n=1 Tax=Streptomyces sp. NBC_00233 TaxID=2975686 RepID=UPI00338FCB97
MPDAVGEVWPTTVVQTCVVHLLRASFRYAARQDWDKIAKSLEARLHRSDRRRGDESVPRVLRGMGHQRRRPVPVGPRALTARRMRALTRRSGGEERRWLVRP